LQIGESFIGEGPNAAHVNTVLGERSGPVGAAWAQALATPSAGHAAFVVAGQPGVAASPPTLFVNKATISGDRHADMTWGAGQAGVARGVARALSEGAIERARCPELVLIAAVWVSPSADDEEEVYANNTEATLQALRNGRAGLPAPEESIEAGLQPWNAFYRPC
jgi:5,6,7,8-tetrahydromethanopterin hydro-lyase